MESTSPKGVIVIDGDLSPADQAKQIEKLNLPFAAEQWGKASNEAWMWSGTLGAMAVYTAPDPPIAALFGVAAALAGVTAGAFGRISNGYTDIANDPPRDDFHVVSRFRPRQYPWDPETSESGATLQQAAMFAGHLADALKTLVNSYERHDSLRLAMRSRHARRRRFRSGDGMR